MQPYEFTLNFVDSPIPVIDIYTESGELVYGVPTKFYFQAWRTSERIDVYDFTNATLGFKPSYSSNTTSPVVVLNGTASTLHRGKGEFTYTLKNDQDYS